MVRYTIFTVLVFLLICCSNRSLSYEDAMKKCMENVTTSEFELEDGGKGIGYRNFDINCIKGAQIPEFKTKDINGIAYDSKKLLGKINVFNFWFEGCTPCVAEIPGLNIIADRYKNEEINFLSMSIDDEKTIREFVEKNEFRFTHLLNGKEIIRNKFQHIGGYPTTIITNNKLEIVEVLNGGAPDSSAIQKVVATLNPIIENLIRNK